jgi:hypothetical protein
MPPQLDTRLDATSLAEQTPKKLNLYVTSAVPYFFNEYRLPLYRGERAAVTETGVNEPVPIADDGHDLYVGSYDDSTIYTYPLPLSSKSQDAMKGAAGDAARYIPPFAGNLSNILNSRVKPSRGVYLGVGDPTGLAVSDGYLYVAGGKVLAYKLPLVSGESPSGSVTGVGSSSFDAWSICVQRDTLYVGSVTTGAVGAYHLPLTNNAIPEYTIPTLAQTDGAMGVAVDPNGTHLYVSLYYPGSIYQYRLPYHMGEVPTVLQLNPQAQGRPYGVAVGDDRLFVTAHDILEYRLPLTVHSKPLSALGFQSDEPADLAVGK